MTELWWLYPRRSGGEISCFYYGHICARPKLYGKPERSRWLTLRYPVGSNVEPITLDKDLWDQR